MKKTFFLIILIVLTACKNTPQNNECFQNINLNQVINLNNPEFIDLNVPGGHTITHLQGRKIILIRRSDNYKAFDLACPEQDCTKNMSFDGLKLICACSKKEYNSLNGSPINGQGCFILEYNVFKSGNTLQISR